MTDPQSLSERLRKFSVVVYNEDGSQGAFHSPICTEAADALDAKDAEIEKWQKLTSEGIAIERELRLQALRLGREEMNTLLAQALEALNRMIEDWDSPSVENARRAREALAAIRKELS